MIGAAFVSVALAAGPTLVARPFADGWMPNLGWSQVRVVLTGGDADTAGVVELVGIDDSVLLSRTVELPGGTTRSLLLPVTPGPVGLPVQVRLVCAGAPPAAQPLTWRRTDAPLVVVIGDRVGDLGHLRRPGTDSAPIVVNVELPDLPERAGVWRNVHDVVWPRADTTGVSLAAQQALVDGVVSGTRLVVTFGDGAVLGPGPLADVLPVTRAGVGLVDLAPLGVALGVAAPLAPVPAALGATRDGPWTLAGDPSAPLWAVGAVGRGFVSWLAVDPDAPSIRAMAPGGQAWRSWLAPGDAAAGLPDAVVERLSARDDGSVDIYAIAVALDEGLGVVGAPPVTPWVAFAAAFLIAVGPVEAVLLGRLRRRAWTWVTFPLISLLFFAVGAAVGGKDRLRWNLGRAVTVLDLPPGSDRAVVDRYFELYTIERRDVVAVSGGPGGLVRPLEEGNAGGLWSPRFLDDGERGSLSWSTQAASAGFFHDAWVGPSPGRLTLDGSGDPWKVANTLPFDADVFLCTGRTCWSLGAVSARAQKVVPRPTHGWDAVPDDLPMRPGWHLVGRVEGTEPPLVTGVDARWDTTTWLRYPIAPPVPPLEFP